MIVVRMILARERARNWNDGVVVLERAFVGRSLLLSVDIFEGEGGIRFVMRRGMVIDFDVRDPVIEGGIDWNRVIKVLDFVVERNVRYSIVFAGFNEVRLIPRRIVMD